MKKCSKCGLKKKPEEFGKSKRKRDGLQSYCKLCATKVAMAWNKANKHNPEVQARIAERARKAINKLREEVDEYKTSRGCVCCPERDPCCLDFHHLGDKDRDVSYFLKAKSRNRVFSEIAKCVVVCSNCHRKIHAGKLQITGEPGSLPGGATAGSHPVS